MKLRGERVLERRVPNTVSFESFLFVENSNLRISISSRSPPPPLRVPAEEIVKLREKTRIHCAFSHQQHQVSSFVKYIKYFVRIASNFGRIYNVDLMRWFIYVKRVDYVKQIFPHLQERKLRIPELRNSLQIEITKRK